MMPRRLPKRYLALAFAVCLGLLTALNLFQTPAEAGMPGIASGGYKAEHAPRVPSPAHQAFLP